MSDRSLSLKNFAISAIFKKVAVKGVVRLGWETSQPNPYF